MTVKGADAQLFRTPGTGGTGAVLNADGCRDLDVTIAGITGANDQWAASAGTPRESHHCLSIAGCVDCCFYKIEFDHPWGDFVYMTRKKIGPSGSDDSYTPSVNVWVTGCYGHHAGRQWVTCQGVKDCVVADNEWDQGKRSGLEMEGLRNAGNGVDGLLYARNRIGYCRLNWIANAGSQRCDNVRIEDNLLSTRPPSIFADIGHDVRRRNWTVSGNRFMRPDEARHFPAIDPLKPPHSGSTGGALFNFTGYDGVQVFDNGTFYLDASRSMSLVKATNCTGVDVHSNDVQLVFGGDSARQWEPKGPGVELRVLP